MAFLRREGSSLPSRSPTTLLFFGTDYLPLHLQLAEVSDGCGERADRAQQTEPVLADLEVGVHHQHVLEELLERFPEPRNPGQREAVLTRRDRPPDIGAHDLEGVGESALAVAEVARVEAGLAGRTRDL